MRMVKETFIECPPRFEKLGLCGICEFGVPLMLGSRRLGEVKSRGESKCHEWK